MKVVLLKNVDKLGKAFEVKEVTKGYAQNFLLPRGLAQMATAQNILTAEVKNKSFQKSGAQAQKAKVRTAKELEGAEIVIKEKAQENGALYGSVNQAKIAVALKNKGFLVEKDQIILNNPLKEIGEFPVEINFNQNIKTKIKIIIQKSA